MPTDAPVAARVPSRWWRSTAATFAVVVACGLTVATGPSPASATTAACDGVTVRVERSGSNATERCVSGRPSNGLQALEQAGFVYTFVPGQPGFVCTIGGFPDPCNDAPADAYWSYWFAEAGASGWTYSGRGAGNRTPPPGSTDAWVYGDGSRPPSSAPPPAPTPAPTPAPSPTPPESSGDGGATAGSGSNGSGSSSGGSSSAGSSSAGSSSAGSSSSTSSSSTSERAAPSGSTPSSGTGPDRSDGDGAADRSTDDDGRPDAGEDDAADADPSAPDDDRTPQATGTPDVADDEDATTTGDADADDDALALAGDEVTVPGSGGRSAAGAAAGLLLAIGLAGAGVLRARRRGDDLDAGL